MKNIRVGRGKSILLPVGSKYIMQIAVPTQVMVFRIPPTIPLCEYYSLEHLYKEKHKVKQNVSLLTINKRLDSFLHLTLECIKDGLSCTKYFDLKITELMYLLRAYYTKEELAGYFYPILNNDMEFSRIILENWSTVKNKTELARMANLSPSRFGVKFKEVFGVPPYQWIISRRSERIFYDLIYTNNSLKQISEEHKFGSVQHFNDFCKKQFGKTPGQIRESKSMEMNTRLGKREQN